MAADVVRAKTRRHVAHISLIPYILICLLGFFSCGTICIYFYAHVMWQNCMNSIAIVDLHLSEGLRGAL